METLLIFVFIIGGSMDGGAATHVHEVRFKDSAACEAAASKVRESGSLWGSGSWRGGHLKVKAVCVSGIR